uniref:Peptidase M28 domain-containing protein n=1 Tax=Amorphochlora amoebiformis TaxID=1561963 RepID=A0A7S0DHN3_9EUKA
MFDDLEPWNDFESRDLQDCPQWERSIPNLEPFVSAVANRITGPGWVEEARGLVECTESRFAGSPGVREAERYLEKTMSEIGLEVFRHETGCLIKENGKRHYFQGGETSFEVVNIIGSLPGNQAEEGVVVVGAHFDSRNHLLSSEGKAPGADDNASGVAAVLQTARIAKEVSDQCGGLPYTMHFLAFGGEEVGLVGSERYVAEYVSKLGDKFKGAIILDQIGFKQPSHTDARIVFETVKTTTQDVSKQILSMIRSLGSGAKALAQDNVDLWCNWFGVGSDHMPFLEKNYPSVLLIARDYLSNEGKHSCYDTMEKLDGRQGALITQVAALTALSLASAEQSKNFQDILSSSNFELPISSGRQSLPSSPGLTTTTQTRPTRPRPGTRRPRKDTSNRLMSAMASSYAPPHPAADAHEVNIAFSDEFHTVDYGEFNPYYGDHEEAERLQHQDRRKPVTLGIDMPMTKLAHSSVAQKLGC